IYDAVGGQRNNKLPGKVCVDTQPWKCYRTIQERFDSSNVHPVICYLCKSFHELELGVRGRLCVLGKMPEAISNVFDHCGPIFGRRVSGCSCEELCDEIAKDRGVCLHPHVLKEHSNKCFDWKLCIACRIPQ